MDEKIQERYENFLNPAVLKQRLVIGSLYIAAFEVLQRSIKERVREFYTRWDHLDPRWESEVRSMDDRQDYDYASLKWLKEMNALSDEDIAIYGQLKKFRNKIAHEMIKLIANEFPSDWAERFAGLISLVDKIERWWILNYEIPINPDFDGQEIDEEDVIPGSVMWLKVMFTVALGNEEEASIYFNEIIKYRKDESTPK